LFWHRRIFPGAIINASNGRIHCQNSYAKKKN
jgi:hypothetical protein